jgi:hypothetical protein
MSVSWADKDIEIIQHVAQFLHHKGVFGNIGRFRTGDGTYYELEVSEGNNALIALKGMLPHLDKKWSQVNGAVDYLENRITADEFIAVLNEAVRIKKRSSALITRSMPYKKCEGRILRGGRPHMRALTRDQVETIKHDKEALGLPYIELAKIYNVHPSTIFLSLKKYAWLD